MKNFIKSIIDRIHRKSLLVKPADVSKSINKCFSCKWCKQTATCMKCKHTKANKGKYGRGNYCYPNSYDDCDCGGFEYSR
jgi:hypothetical protein